VLALDVVIILVLIAVNGVLAMSELAVVSARTHRLARRAEEGDAGAKIALELAQEPTRFLSTIQIGITLVAIVAGAFGGAAFGGHISPAIESLGVSENTADGIGVAIAVAVITYLSLVFGEIVPKRVALHSPETVASIVSRPMRLLATLGAPFVALLSASTSFILGLAGLQRPREDSITEEEIRLMIGMSAESGSVEEDEAALLDRVFHFGDRQVHEVMTPRNLAVGVERRSTIGDFYAVYLETPHSRFPVFDESPDKVVGILGIKDVLGAVARGEVTTADPIEPLIRSGLFTPESKPIDDLFRELQATGNQMAIAVDEFGGTAGIVTLEQLLEEMVGQVRDELAAGNREITRIDGETTEVQGALSVDEARDELGLDIPEGPYDTIAGYVLSVLGHIPKVGEVVDVDHHRLTVAEMNNLRIESLRVTRV
jgi:magnesium and cobalt exporter, CNNM family